MLQFEVLIGEAGSIDGLTTSAVVASEITTLQHEVWDNTVEGGTFEVQLLQWGTSLTSAKSSENDW